MHIRHPLSTKWTPRALQNGAIVEHSSIDITIEATETYLDLGEAKPEDEKHLHRVVRLEIANFFSIDVPFEGPLAEVPTIRAAVDVARARAAAYLATLPDLMAPLIDQAGAALVAGSR